MLRNFQNILLKSSKSLFKNQKMCFNSDIMQDKEKAEEKIYMMRKDKENLKKLKKKMMNKMLRDDQFFDLSEDRDIENILEDQEWLKRTLNENGIVNNAGLVKILLKWKYD